MYRKPRVRGANMMILDNESFDSVNDLVNRDEATYDTCSVPCLQAAELPLPNMRWRRVHLLLNIVD